MALPLVTQPNPFKTSSPSIYNPPALGNYQPQNQFQGGNSGGGGSNRINRGPQSTKDNITDAIYNVNAPQTTLTNPTPSATTNQTESTVSAGTQRILRSQQAELNVVNKILNNNAVSNAAKEYRLSQIYGQDVTLSQVQNRIQFLENPTASVSIIKETPIEAARKQFQETINNPDIPRYERAGFTPEQSVALARFSASTQKTPTGEIANAYVESLGLKNTQTIPSKVTYEDILFYFPRKFSQEVNAGYPTVAGKGALGYYDAVLVKTISDLLPKRYLDVGLLGAGALAYEIAPIKAGLIFAIPSAASYFTATNAVEKGEAVLLTGLSLLPSAFKKAKVPEDLAKLEKTAKKTGEPIDVLAEARRNLKVEALRENPVIESILKIRESISNIGETIGGGVQRGGRYIVGVVEGGRDYVIPKVNDAINKIVGSPPNFNPAEIEYGRQLAMEVGLPREIGFPFSKGQLADIRLYLQDSFRALGKRTEDLFFESPTAKPYGELGIIKRTPTKFTPEELAAGRRFAEELGIDTRRAVGKQELATTRKFVRTSFDMLKTKVLSLNDILQLGRPRGLISTTSVETSKFLPYSDYGLIGKGNSLGKIKIGKIYTKADTEFVYGKGILYDIQFTRESFKLLSSKSREIVTNLKTTVKSPIIKYGAEFDYYVGKTFREGFSRIGSRIGPKAISNKISGRITQVGEKIDLLSRALTPKSKLPVDILPFSEDLFLNEQAKYITNKRLSEAGLGDSNINKLLAEKPEVLAQVRARLKAAREIAFAKDTGIPNDLRDTLTKTIQDEKLSELTTRVLGSKNRPREVSFLDINKPRKPFEVTKNIEPESLAPKNEPKNVLTISKDENFYSEPILRKTKQQSITILKEPEQILKNQQEKEAVFEITSIEKRPAQAIKEEEKFEPSIPSYITGGTKPALENIPETSFLPRGARLKNVLIEEQTIINPYSPISSFGLVGVGVTSQVTSRVNQGLLSELKSEQLVTNKLFSEQVLANRNVFPNVLQTQSQLESQRQSQFSLSLQLERQVQQSRQKQLTRQVELSLQIPRLGSIERQISRVEERFAEPQRTVQELRQTEIPKEIKLLLMEKDRTRKRQARLQQLYLVQLRKRGKYVPIARGLTRGAALSLGSERALNDIARTFRIRPEKTTETFGGVEVDFMPNVNAFRTYAVRQGKKVSLVDTYIQLTSANLKSFREKEQLRESRALKRNMRLFSSKNFGLQ